MYCSNCGNKYDENAKFCGKCGTSRDTAKENHVASHVPVPAPKATASGAVVKCGNCGYEGSGEKNRNIIFVVLAWLCVLFAPLITILYFVATAKWRCPKCRSTFLGIKGKDGNFAGQRNSNIAVVIIVIVLAIAFIGILASVVLASLGSARGKARDASRVSHVKQIQLALELYYDENKEYPTSLTPLAPSFIDEVPVDPAGGAYAYSLCSTDSYHLGASLENETNTALEKDADNVKICVGDQVSGSDSQKCSPSDVGNHCYDVTPIK